MIINQVSMRDFIAYHDAVIDFPLGVTVIVGQNGAGKTTILDAITYSLFKEHGRGVEENLIRRGRDKAKVRVRFTVRGRKYEVEWTIQRGKTSAGSLRDIEKQMPLVMPGMGEKTLVPAVERVVGLDSKIFMNAIYVRQGQIAKLLEDRPAERKKTIAHLLGIDELEKLWEALKEPIALLRKDLDIYGAKLERISTLQTQLSEKTATLNRNLRDLEALASEIETLSEEAQNLEQALEDFEQKRKRDEEINKEIITLESRLENRKTEKKALDDRIQELEAAYRDLEAHRANYIEYLKLENIHKTHTAMLLELEKQLEKKKEVKALMERKKVEAESISKQVTEYLERFREIVGMPVKETNAAEVWEKITTDLERKIHETEERINSLWNRRNTYNILGTVLATSLTLASIFIYLTTQNIITLLINIPSAFIYLTTNRMKKTIDEKILNLRAGRTELLNRKTQLIRVDPTNFRKMFEKQKQLTEEATRLRPDAMEVENLEKQQSQLKNEIQKIRQELEMLQPSRDKYRLASSVLEKHHLQTPQQLKELIVQLMNQSETFSSEIDEIRSRLGRLETEKKSIAYDEQRHQETVKKYEKASTEKTRAEQNYAVLSNTIQHLREDITVLETQLSELAQIKEKHDKLESYIKSLERVREIYHKDGDLQKVMRKQASTSVEKIARLFLQQFELQFDDIRIDENFDVKLYGRNGEQTVDMLSGGEKLVVAIALRLAIAAALAGDRLESIIMDEPTIHLDTERRGELVNVLKNFRGGGRLIPQVIVVSHDREL
ncbi:MAG: AAA family ATPase, partial [Candidatus Caldarchaeum sp.]|nr:AAA family ATPase [Candidatus Caldarchaeum sp.]MDW8436000.1 AAA family ATPase [Candidatus Caldarchaeum sp.]